MDLQIREEYARDFGEIHNVITAAFQTAKHSDGDEQDLVLRLRSSEAYIPQLALVAIREGTLVGYVMLTAIRIGGCTAVAAAPLAVHPEHQRLGIGTALLGAAHEKARALGFTCCVLLGDPAYYSRFGYEPAELFGIHTHLEVPSIHYMALPLQSRSVPSGFVVYPSAWSF